MYRVTEDNEIHVTRGDVLGLEVRAKQGEGYHIFQGGDVIRFTIYEKKNAEAVVLQKDFSVDVAGHGVPIFLTKEDTELGEPISKPKDYWYNVTVNPDTFPDTIIGYWEEGAKLFRIYPKGEKE
jgi:hypothetical protein